MSNTENPGTVNAIDEQIDENEESSGLKVRTSLKAGYTLDYSTGALGLSGPRRDDPTLSLLTSATISTR